MEFSVEKHLHSKGKVQKSGAWISRALSDNNKGQGSQYPRFSSSSPLNSWTQATISLLNCYWRQKIVPVHQYETAQGMA